METLSEFEVLHTVTQVLRLFTGKQKHFLRVDRISLSPKVRDHTRNVELKIKSNACVKKLTA